jgi:hypothetical protein
VNALAASLVAALLAQAPALDGGARDGGTPFDAGSGGDGGAPRDGRATPEVAAGADASGTPPARAPAPTARLQGQVVGKGGRLPVAGAVVTVDGVGVTETDAGGHFAADVPPGRHHVQIQQPGFEIGEHVVDVGGAAGVATEPLVVRLVPRAGGEMYETVVRNRVPEAPAVALQKQEMTRIPGTLGDPFRAIETLPGVATVAWPLPIYAVRGANPGNTGFFLDGMRVPALFHFALGPAVIHPYFLEGLDFYPGGYPARYGRFVGGAVVAATRAPPADLVHGSADVRLFDAGLMASGPFHGGKGTVEIAGRYSYTAALLSLLNSDVDVSYSDAQLRIDHPLGPGQLTLVAFGSSDDLRSKNPMNANDRLIMRFARGNLRWTVPVAGGHFLIAAGGGVDATRAPYQRNAVNPRGLSLFPRLSYRRPFTSWLEGEIGADGEYQSYSTTLEAPDPALVDLARPRSASLLGVYAMANLRFGSRLVLVPAYRGDAYQQGGVERFDAGPRLLARVRAARDVWLKGSFGRYSQMPSLPLQVAGIEAFGLAQHGLQTSWLGAVGVETPLVGGVSLDTNVYVQRYVLTDLRDPDNGDYLVDDFLVRRDALSYGVEVMLRRPFTSRLSGWLAYTLSRSLRAFEGGAIGPSDWDQRHILNLVASYRFGRYTIGGRAHYNTGRPVKVKDLVPVQYQRLPAFYQIDLRVERRSTFDKFTMHLYLELVNATLNRQVTSLGLGLDDQIHENSMRIVIPSIGVRAEM